MFHTATQRSVPAFLLMPWPQSKIQPAFTALRRAGIQHQKLRMPISQIMPSHFTQRHGVPFPLFHLSHSFTKFKIQPAYHRTTTRRQARIKISTPTSLKLLNATFFVDAFNDFSFAVGIGPYAFSTPIKDLLSHFMIAVKVLPSTPLHTAFELMYFPDVLIGVDDDAHHFSAIRITLNNMINRSLSLNREAD